MIEQPSLPIPRHSHRSRMPIDKQSNSKPITPALSSNFPANTKSPLTPRLVGSALNSPASSTRRDAFIRARSPAREPAAPTPLSGNITPRTAARKSRIGTDSPATPASQKSAVNARPRPVSGTKSGLEVSSSGDRVHTSAPALQAFIISPTPVYTVHRRVSGAKSAIHTQGDEASKFFRADDARSHVSERPLPTSDSRSFFFVGSPSAQSSASPEMLPVRDDRFFQADELRPQTTSKGPLRPVHPNKTVSTPNGVGRTQYIDATRSETTFPQSTSPGKNQRSDTQPNSPQTEDILKVLPPTSPGRQNVDRRGSVGSSISSVKAVTQAGHHKSMSASSISAAPQRKVSSPRLVPLPGLDQRLAEPNASTISLPRSVTSASSDERFGAWPLSITGTTASPQPVSEVPPHAIASPTLEPTILTPSSDTFSNPSQASSKPQPDAANARRERKVLDLEISNSSLLAINKTLEKELRKQTSELRRFRRLSRSGRLSMAPTNRSISASTLDAVAEGEGEDFDRSDVEDDSDFDAFDDETEDVLSNDSSSVHSPTSRARQRARDEKRLMLDLSKHQQMLLDSQKLTQSIRRCLTCTEELISDGNKALEYRVGIGDVNLGGRVLSHEEVDEKESDSSEEASPQRKGLLSPTVTLSQLEEATLWLTTGVGNGSTQEVDETIQDINAELNRYIP